MIKKNIYIVQSGRIERKDNTIRIIKDNDEKKFLPVENVGMIYVFGEVDLNKRILEFLAKNEILLHFFNYYGYYIGSFYPREHYNSGYLILQQAQFYNDLTKRIELAKYFIFGASKNAYKNLRYYNERKKDISETMELMDDLINQIDEQDSIESLMSVEGRIKSLYFNAFDLILINDDFVFQKRTKRPPLNYLNTLISFINSLIYTEVLSAIYKTHLDPRIGFLHATNFRRFSLNLDVAEIFKPIIGDRLIFTLVNKNIITGSSFEKDTLGFKFKENALKEILQKFDDKLNTTLKIVSLKKIVSYKHLILLELYKLEKHLMNEKKYNPLILERWMFVILVYDISERRVSKALKICRKYLNWVQNSVFEGEISESKLERLKYELKRMMNLEEDSVIIYTFRTTKYSNREIIGIEKNRLDNVI